MKHKGLIDTRDPKFQGGLAYAERAAAQGSGHAKEVRVLYHTSMVEKQAMTAACDRLALNQSEFIRRAVRAFLDLHGQGGQIAPVRSVEEQSVRDLEHERIGNMRKMIQGALKTRALPACLSALADLDYILAHWERKVAPAVPPTAPLAKPEDPAV